ncbi:MAG: PAS domain S-box protein [Lentisphaerae bacterium]|jgi:PAS domain S-box-containing protein|nr:PAS domain S-box protein [Lentisphaerota bacterium]
MKLWFKKSQTKQEAPPSEPRESVIAKPVSEDPVAVSDGKGEAESVKDSGVAAGDGKTSSLIGKGDVAYKSDHRSLYKQLLAGLYDAVLIADPKGHIIDMNARVTEFFGFTLEEAWDMPISELVPGINATLITRIHKGLAGERFVLLDGRCVRKDRSTFAAEIAISSISLMNDNDLVFCIRNIDRRHMQLQRLKSCQSLLNHAVSASAACDVESKIKVANTALGRLLGYNYADELHGKPFALLWNEPGSEEVIKRVLGGEQVKETVQVRNSAGTRLQMNLSLAPEYDARKKIIGFLVTFAPAAVVSLGGGKRVEE